MGSVLSVQPQLEKRLYCQSEAPQSIPDFTIYFLMVMRWYETLSFVSTFVLSSSYYKLLPILLITTVGLFSDAACPLEAATPC